MIKPWVKVCILNFIYGYFIVPMSEGYLQVSSNIEDVSEVMCLGNVTFLCNAELDSQTIGWYKNNTLIGEYSFSNRDSFPRVIPSELGFDIQLYSASADFQATTVRFINFSLSISLDQIPELQGMNLTCGSLFERIDVINISNETLMALSTFNAMYTAIYYGEDENLMQINVHWNDLGTPSSCYYTYVVEMSTNNELLYNTSFTSEDCVKATCFKEIRTVPNELEDDIHVVIYATPINGTNTATAERIISHSGSLLGNNIELNNCTSSITCSSLGNGSCIIQYGSNSNYESFSESVTLQVNTSHNFNFNFQTWYYIQITKMVNSVDIIQRINYNTTGNKSSGLSYLITGYAVLCMAIILLVIGYIYCLSSCRTRECDRWVFCQLCFGLIISTILFFLSLVLLVTYQTNTTYDECGNKVHQSSLGISALFFSFLCLAVSPIMCGGFCLFIQPKKYKAYAIKNDEEVADIELQEDEQEVNIAFTFGLVEQSPPKIDSLCINCNANTDEAGAVCCKACQKFMCSNCGEKAVTVFIPWLDNDDVVCNLCDEQYWKENIYIFESKKFSEVVTVLRNQDSWVETIYKDIHKGQQLKECRSCRQEVCSDSFKKLDFAENQEVCVVCYMLHIRKFHLIKRYYAITNIYLNDEGNNLKEKDLTVELLMKVKSQIS